MSKPAPTNDEIGRAIEDATHGNCRKLARLLKSFTLDELTIGLRGLGTHGAHNFRGLHITLLRAAGAKEERLHTIGLNRVRRSMDRAMQIEASATPLRAFFEAASKGGRP